MSDRYELERLRDAHRSLQGKWKEAELDRRALRTENGCLQDKLRASEGRYHAVSISRDRAWRDNDCLRTENERLRHTLCCYFRGYVDSPDEGGLMNEPVTLQAHCLAVQTLDALAPQPTEHKPEEGHPEDYKWKMKAPAECGNCRGPDCEGCEQSPHWYWWRGQEGADGE